MDSWCPHAGSPLYVPSACAWRRLGNVTGGFSITDPPSGFAGNIFYVTAATMWISGITAAIMVVVDFIAIISGRFRDGDGNLISEWT